VTPHDPRWRRETRRWVRLARLTLHVATGLALAHTALPWLRAQHSPRGANHLVRWWTRRLVRILGIEVVVEGQARTQPTLFVANHISWLDIPVLRAAVDTYFVSKAEVQRWPAVGALAERAGTLFIERGRSDAAVAVSERMTWTLARGESMLMFPEGTTSRGESLRFFHPRLYAPAVHTGTPVQAIALTYTDGRERHPLVPFVDEVDFLPHLWTLAASPRVVARLHFCEPVTTKNRPRRQLADTNRAQVLGAIGLTAPVDATAASQR
jgi:1-acyl-sn-glycerol-3-phosphate acyltransferase